MMEKITVHSSCRSMLADVFTPVGIYLRLRDRFRDTILLESTDHHSAENSYSFICINAIGGIEISSTDSIEFKFPGQPPHREPLDENKDVASLLWKFMQRFEINSSGVKEEKFAQGLYGYMSYDAVQFFESIKFKAKPANGNRQPVTGKPIPLIRYRLYQYVIAVNHFRDELFICENRIDGIESELTLVESLIRSKDVPVYPFHAHGEEQSNMPGEDYMR